jgi:catechol 2,3-dioxygenase-like lactoylglutathione lyase family enzyme
MTVSLDHTIVPATDNLASAQFLAGILGLPTGERTGYFVPVVMANGVTLDFMDATDVSPGHYAFHVDASEFDAIFERVRAAGDHWADPARQRKGETYEHLGNRGFYYNDPDGHRMEVFAPQAN